MYRRVAIERFGFDESLVTSEDVDLSWKVVQSGYQLRYVPRAAAVHHDGSSWYGFLKKHYYYGVATSRVAHRHRVLRRGAKTISLWSWRARDLESRLTRAYYWAGYHWQSLRFRWRLEEIPPFDPPQPLPRFRPRFAWDENRWLTIASDAIYWPFGDEMTIVSPNRGLRFVLEGVGAIFWEGIAEGAPRSAIIDRIAQGFDADPQSITGDLDEFIDRMLREQLLNLS